MNFQGARNHGTKLSDILCYLTIQDLRQLNVEFKNKRKNETEKERSSKYFC